MPQDPNALVWIDLEMTGLNPDTDLIIEIATIVTDANLNILAEGPVLAIHQGDDVLNGMDEWNTRTHGKTGLTERVRNTTTTVEEAEQQTIDFISQYCVRNKSPLCGNTICQDRRFMFRHMPKLEAWVHYRNLDVSVLKELAKRWRPDVLDGIEKKNTHKALDDIRESIEELRHYREVFLKLG
jgi:oligoribonuclease